jgi:hypothetical protein
MAWLGLMPTLTVNTCLVCEDIRLERRNLNSYMGVFGSTPDVGVRLRSFDADTSLVFVFMGPGVDGKFNLRAEIHGPNGPIDFKITPKIFTLEVKKSGGPFTFAFRVTGRFPSADKYYIAVFDDTQEFFRGVFEIGQGQAADFT